MADDSSELLRIEIVEGGIRLFGEIDSSVTDSLAAHLNPLPGESGDIVIHLAGVEFIDSSGLRELIGAHQRAETIGRCVLMTEPSAVVIRIFEIAGLQQYLHLA